MTVRYPLVLNGTTIEELQSGDALKGTGVTGSPLLKGDGAGGFAGAIVGTDYAEAAPGTAGQLIGSDGAGGFDAITLGGGLNLSGGVLTASGLLVQSVQTADFTATIGKLYPINTTAGVKTVTLPGTPAVGDQVAILDYAGTANTYPIIVNPNGGKIAGDTAVWFTDLKRNCVVFTYIDSTQGWEITSSTTWADARVYDVSFTVVAGGGGNPAGPRGWVGGAGGGGVRSGTLTPTPGVAYTVTVGGGGSSSNGSNSTFNSITSAGGGYGGYYNDNNGTQTSGQNGGCGGGPNGLGNTPATSPAQGYGTASGSWGGGGAGGASTGPYSWTLGNGGVGVSIPHYGNTVGGGGGSGAWGVYSAGSASDGGGTGNGTAGATNRGGGAGGTNGSGGYSAVNGGSGIVVISVPLAARIATTTGSPSVTTDATHRTYAFTGSGTITF